MFSPHLHEGPSFLNMASRNSIIFREEDPDRGGKTSECSANHSHAQVIVMLEMPKGSEIKSSALLLNQDAESLAGRQGCSIIRITSEGSEEHVIIYLLSK